MQPRPFYHVMLSCACQALSKLLFIPLQISPVPTAHPPPASCRPQHLPLVGNTVQGSGDFFKKTTSSERGNEYLFILKYEKLGALEHEGGLRF